MKRFTRIFSIIFTVALIISIFPAAKADAAEKYKLSLTGECDLDDDAKVIYNYSKMMKNVKLEKVEGKNQWTLTMYAGTTVVLPYLMNADVDKVEYSNPNSKYVNVLEHGSDMAYSVTAHERTLESKKKIEKNVLTFKAYNKAGKCLTTMKIDVTILPYNAKLERTKLVTAKQLLKIGYHRQDYSDFVWDRVVTKYPEVLLHSNNTLLSYYTHVAKLEIYGRKIPQYLFDQFSGKDSDELMRNIYKKEAHEVWGYDEELMSGAKYATSCGTDRFPGQKAFDQLDAIFEELDLEQYTTDWEKVLAFQNWVVANIKYKIVYSNSVLEALNTGYAQCEGYANLMCIACQRLDIPCYFVADPFYMDLGHAWNIVLVDGLWCMMDLTGSPGFNAVDYGDFRGEPSVAAVERVKQVFGGEAYLTAADVSWSSYKECWVEDTEDFEVRDVLTDLNRLKDWEYLPQKYQELIEREATVQAWSTYRTLEDIPQHLRNLWDIWGIFVDEQSHVALLDDYQEWMEEDYDPKEDEEFTFIYWYLYKHLLGGYGKWPKEYSEWLNNEYDSELHGNIPVIYWLQNVANDSERLCNCWRIFENFPDIFENVSEFLMLKD